MTEKQKPCRVAGVFDGVLYEVVITGRAARPAVGSKRISALIEQYAGRPVLATPVGPTYTVDPTDVASIVTLLSTYTQVRRIEAAPDLGVRSPVAGVR